MSPNDPRSFEDYGPYLKLLARLQMGSWLQARIDPSDLVQEALLRAHRAAGQMDGQPAAARVAWLHRALANVLADEVRRHSRAARSVHLERSLEASSQCLGRLLANDQSTPSEVVLQDERLRQLAEALECLTEDQRLAIELKYLRGLTVEAVAAQMCRSVTAVVGLLRRGISRLREQLAVQE